MDGQDMTVTDRVGWSARRIAGRELYIETDAGHAGGSVGAFVKRPKPWKHTITPAARLVRKVAAGRLQREVRYMQKCLHTRCRGHPAHQLGMRGSSAKTYYLG